MKSGLYALAGDSATATEAACANRFEEPMTNVSNMYFGLSRLPSDGLDDCRRSSRPVPPPPGPRGCGVCICAGGLVGVRCIRRDVMMLLDTVGLSMRTVVS